MNPHTPTAILSLLLAFCQASPAQTAGQLFCAHLYSEACHVSMHIDFYGQGVTVPGGELFGPVAGYLKRDGTSYCWLVVRADIDGVDSGSPRATLLMSNDYGSEDCQAELTVQGDTLYTLRHLKGSALKVPDKGKWQKLPKVVELKRKKTR